MNYGYFWLILVNSVNTVFSLVRARESRIVSTVTAAVLTILHPRTLFSVNLQVKMMMMIMIMTRMT